MAIGNDLVDGKQQVQSADHVVHLREHGVLAVDHGVRRGPLLGEVNYRVRLEGPDRGGEKLVIGNIPREEVDGLSSQLLPGAQALGERPNRGQSLRANFMIPMTAQKVVDNRNLVPSIGEK